jgi:glyceraldehyde 3-phosphate dehydrogenase
LVAGLGFFEWSTVVSKPIRILINSFGRIGRTVMRQILTSPENADIEVVAINDIAPIETCAYLFKYDSVFGPYAGMVSNTADSLEIERRCFPFFAHSDLRSIDLNGVDVVLECTGNATTRSVAQAGLDAGASNVLISGPSEAADTTVVLGANENEIKNAKIVSNASCTTNAIAPLLRALDLGFGVETAHITTIHCYTGSQPTVDTPRANFERSRAAAVSMVPTTTSAADQVAKVLPHFKNRLSVTAVRVPTISVSAIDAVIQMSETPDEPMVDFLRTAFSNFSHIGLTEDACVSSDLRGRSESIIIALPETKVVGQKQLRIFGWYDNEWAFSARMIEMTRRLAERDNKDEHHG